MKYSEICCKQVINVVDGALIGLVNDVVFDPCTFVIHAIIVHPSQSCIKKLFPWFFQQSEIEINVSEIETLCGDVILVKFR